VGIRRDRVAGQRLQLGHDDAAAQCQRRHRPGAVAGYVDYIDRLGQALGTGATAPDGTAYVRRWSIEPLPTNPNNTLIIQVMVFETGKRPASGDTTTTRLPNEARVATVKTRKAL
jgi:hypothetical protein